MQLVLHLGAHRSASTAIAEAFWLSREAVNAAGVAFRGPIKLRAIPDFQGVARLTREAAAGELSAAAALVGVTEALRSDMRRAAGAGRTRYVMSEENILGFMQDNIARRTLYADLPARLAAYARVLPKRPRRIAMGLRAYDSLWISTYLYVLLREPLPPFEVIAGSLAASPRGWPEIMADIRHAFPEAELIVWRQEDLGRVFAPVIAALGDIPTASGIVLPERRVNAGWNPADAGLVHHLRETDPGLAGDALKRALEGFAGDRPSQGPAFAPDTAQALRARYDADLAGLRDTGVRVIAPDDRGQP